MLISADLTPLKKLTQDHPTARVIDLRQQLHLTPYAHVVKCKFKTSGQHAPQQIVEFPEESLPLTFHVWNVLAACNELQSCPFNAAKVDDRLAHHAGISEEEDIVHFEPVLQIDPVSLAPLQLTKFDSLRLHQALVNTSESSEALDLCMTAMAAKGWVTYSPNLHKWEWHVPNDYPKAVADMLYRKGLIDSKQAFISVCISQTGTPMNPKSTNITEGNNVQKLVMDLLNPILRCSSSSSSDNLNLLLPKHLRLCTRDRITPEAQ